MELRRLHDVLATFPQRGNVKWLCDKVRRDCANILVDEEEQKYLRDKIKLGAVEMERWTWGAMAAAFGSAAICHIRTHFEEYERKLHRNGCGEKQPAQSRH